MIISYLFLFASIAVGAIKGFCGKKTSFLVSSFSDAVYVNTVRFLICAAIGAAVCLASGGLAVTPTALLICALSGVTQAVFVTTWLLSVHSGAYTTVEVFLTVGMILPIVLSKVCFGESIAPRQYIGFLLLVVAVYIMCCYNSRVKARFSGRTFLLLVLCSLFNGLADFSQKLFVKTQSLPVSSFNFYTYVFAAATLFFILSANRLLKKEQAAVTCSIRSFGGYIAVMAVCLFLYSYFKTLAGKELSAMQIYPICQGCGMILSALMAHFIFKERISRLCVCGIVLAFAALMLITL